MPLAGETKSKKSSDEPLAEVKGGMASTRADDSGVDINLFDFLVKSTTKVDIQTAAESSLSSVHSSTSNASSKRRRQLRVKRYSDAGDEVSVEESDIPESAPCNYKHEGSGSVSSFLSLNASGQNFQRSHEGGTGIRSGRAKRNQTRVRQPSTISWHGTENDDGEKLETARSLQLASNDAFITVSTEEGNVIIRKHDSKHELDVVQLDGNQVIDISPTSGHSTENRDYELLPIEHGNRENEIIPTATTILPETNPAISNSSQALDVESDANNSSGSPSDEDEDKATPLYSELMERNVYSVKSQQRVSIRMGDDSGDDMEPKVDNNVPRRSRVSILKNREVPIASYAYGSEKNFLQEEKIPDHELGIKTKDVPIPEEYGRYNAARNDDDIRSQRRRELEQRKRQLENIARAAIVQRGNLVSRDASRNKPTRQRTVNIDVYTGEIIEDMPKIATLLKDGRGRGGDDGDSHSSYSSTEYDTPAEKWRCDLGAAFILLILVGTGLGIYFGLYFENG